MRLQRRGPTLRQRGSKPASQKSEDKRQEERRRRLEVIAVARRVKDAGDLCELGCGRLADDCHHVWHRHGRPGIPEAVAWSRESMLGICRPCHDEIHRGNLALIDQAQTMAVSRFAEKHGLVFGGLLTHEDALEAIRRLVREWEGRQA